MSSQQRMIRKVSRCSLILLCVSVYSPGFCNAQSLTGKVAAHHRIYLPGGDGPFPTVVAIPGCSGVSFDGPETDAGRPGDEGDRLFRRHYPRMAERLRAAGFAVILVDYLSAEGVGNTCRGEIRYRRVGEYVGASIAFARDLPTTDSERLFAIGWSHGGAGVIAWLATLGSNESPADGAVAVYPGCNSLGPWQSPMPVLVLLGSADDIALPEECRRVARELPEATGAIFQEYPDGRHGFDMTEGPEMLELGGGLTLGRNEEAGNAAWAKIFEFFEEVRGGRQDSARYDGPIIDVHLHAYGPESYHRAPNAVTGRTPESRTAAAHMEATLNAMNEHNVVLGLVSASLEEVEVWRQFAPDRFVAGVLFGRAGVVSIQDLRERFEDGRLGLMGEITAQYEGLSPSDPELEPFFALAEELDVPVGVHTGNSAPGTPITGHPATGVFPNFRLRYGNPLLLEDVLVRHPDVRVFMMHMGTPWLTETLAMLHMYPHLYVDLSIKNWVLPRDVFHRHLKQLVDAGYVKRLMFGSDQMLWPETIGMAIEAIQSADFLTLEQKADIFYNNAARFLRLNEEEVQVHHGR